MLNLVPCASSFQVGSAIGEAKAPPKPMTMLSLTKFHQKLADFLSDTPEGRELANEVLTVAQLHADYIKSGKTFEEWTKEFTEEKELMPKLMRVFKPNQ